MTEVILTAAELQAVCQSQDWQFCFIGGLALQRWGEPRESVDVDLTLLTGFGGEEQFIQILLKHFEGRIPDADEFARKRRVLLLRSRKGSWSGYSARGFALVGRRARADTARVHPRPADFRAVELNFTSASEYSVRATKVDGLFEINVPIKM